MELLRLILLLWLVAVYGARGASSTRHGEAIQEDGETSHGNTSQAEQHGIHLYSWRWNETYYGIKFYRPIIMSSLIIFAVAFKIIFHHLSFLEQMLPESCVLILVGMVFGILNTQFIGTNSPFPVFSANLFFNILLPPIILDSSISLYNKQFFATFYSVIIFAVFGTLFNVLTIGFSLYGLSQSGVLGGFIDDHHLTLFPCLTFASLIAAVDPVAVLAIFEQIEVNAGLYFLVFGESLFNDGACVVLYNSMNTLAGLAEVGPQEILMSVLSFFTVAFGGALIGFIHGMFVSAISRFTKHVRIVEPLTVLSCAYSSFLWAEVFHWSGIISIIAYGVTAKHYAFQNISQKSFTTVKYSVKTLACISDCIIFLFLGMSIFTEQHYYHPGFITATILLCLIFRLLSTLLFSALVNLKRVDKISLK
jgi:sodium/hydrogen exchanger 3